MPRIEPGHQGVKLLLKLCGIKEKCFIPVTEKLHCDTKYLQLNTNEHKIFTTYIYTTTYKQILQM